MASTTSVVSSLPARTVQTGPALAPAPRPSRWGWLQLLRDALGGALLLAAWLALWTVTWAAVAGPLSPVREAAPRAAASSVERT
jgi:hypothetical protein